MKNIFKLVLVASFLGGIAKAAPQSYPMQCRGGGQLTLGLSTTDGTALLYFQKAPNKASQGLKPGECAWLDRAIGANEPVCLRQTGVIGNAWMFPNQMGNNYFSTQNAEWLRNLLKADKFQTFRVYNPGNNCFVVTALN